MAVKYLKSGIAQAQRAEDDAAIRSNVEQILSDIEANGDSAVRALSEKFDSYSPATFTLSASEIEALMNKASDSDMHDIKFAQEQVWNFARIQRESMRDVEIETMPGVVLGHKHYPVRSLWAAMYLVENSRWLPLPICR